MASKSYPLRHATPAQLAEGLQQARANVLELFECLQAQGLDKTAKVPRLPEINPPLWELGYIAWFCEWYVLREATSSHPGSALRPSLLTKGDDWFDPNTVPQSMRWNQDLPTAGALKTYCHEVLDRCLDKLSRTAHQEAALYPFRLALAHEDMRAESMVMAMQLLNVMPPARLATPAVNNWAQGEIRFPGGSIQVGYTESGFAFDNELPPCTQRVDAFRMDSTLVSNAQFLQFIEDGGYQRPQFWTEAGRAWLMHGGSLAPRYWQRDEGRWVLQRFGQKLVLPLNEAVRHVNLYEAQAYCVWAERRLPLEEEWEFAARSGHAALRWGDLWEWTASPFLPYPGFQAGPWREYSQQRFAKEQSLRGLSFATPSRLRHTAFRHSALPLHNHFFTGFRTCAW